ncbi:MAG: TAXI family TRAP transporter solute-binding subunit [Proteobacteria bacterium]|nr:TAXI family TRAP transporter solute-binding subunit [Pseudomonadota bacterium]
MTSSKSILGFAAVVTAGALLVTVVTPASAQLKRITIGTNPAGTTYFTLGGGFAKLFQEKLGLRSTAQPHAGSSVYLPLMDKGEITLGLNSTLDSALAFAGKPPYKNATKNVRALARIWQLPYNYFVRANSGLKTISDLRGKRVQVGIKSNVSLQQLNETILATGGLTLKDVTALESGGIVSGINMVVEGRADAAVSAMGIPVLRKANAGIPGGVRVLSLGDKGTPEFMDSRTAGATSMVINPSKRNVGVLEPTRVAAFQTLLNISAKVSDKDAYMLAKTLRENWEDLQKSYAPLRGVMKDKLAVPLNPIPYHDGAVKYYKEAGIWSDANDKHRSMIMK